MKSNAALIDALKTQANQVFENLTTQELVD